MAFDRSESRLHEAMVLFFGDAPLFSYRLWHVDVSPRSRKAPTSCDLFPNICVNRARFFADELDSMYIDYAGQQVSIFALHIVAAPSINALKFMVSTKDKDIHTRKRLYTRHDFHSRFGNDRWPDTQL
jgi:hypothetical protein